MGHGGDGAIDVGGITLDRSNVHILLCDRDPETGMQAMRLLQKCSYKVTCVKSAGQVIEVLDSASLEIDLVLAELELPKEKGFKLLKHIVRQEQLRRIPVVMMSAQDEMSLVMRCLRLGAVDFLLKPLRCNELLNLWTHTWRRRRMLGITEKHFLKGNLRVPFDLILSETSESNNTNSTNLFSDDTDDQKLTAAPENCASSHELESEVSPQLELSLKPSVGATLEVVAKHGPNAGLMPSPPRKSNLKLGQSSAFLTYSKVINQPSKQPVDEVQFDGNTRSMHISTSRSQLQSPTQGSKNSALTMADGHGVKSPYRPSSSVPSSEDHVLRKRPPLWDAVPCRNEILEKQSSEHIVPSEQAAPSHPNSTEGQVPFVNYYSQECAPNTSSITTLPASQFVGGSVLGPVLHCPPLLSQTIQLYHGLQSDDGIAAGVPAIHVQPTHGLNLPTFPFYPFGLHMATGPQVGPFPGWHPTPVNQLFEQKLGKSERREAALHKFRLKRKDRCFEKKIRYASRKKLAEQRPRIRGQFVRRETDTDVTENGMLDDYDDEDDEDQGLCEVGDGSSPESIAEDA